MYVIDLLPKKGFGLSAKTLKNIILRLSFSLWVGMTHVTFLKSYLINELTISDMIQWLMNLINYLILLIVCTWKLENQ